MGRTWGGCGLLGHLDAVPWDKSCHYQGMVVVFGIDEQRDEIGLVLDIDYIQTQATG